MALVKITWTSAGEMFARAARIDGQPVKGHVDVSNDGMVQYHPLPNYSFMSSVEMVRTLIDTFPDDFKLRRLAAKAPSDASAGDERTEREGIEMAAIRRNILTSATDRDRTSKRIALLKEDDASSPNDPAFFLNHCNVDRIWAA